MSAVKQAVAEYLATPAGFGFQAKEAFTDATRICSLPRRTRGTAHHLAVLHRRCGCLIRFGVYAKEAPAAVQRTTL
jgi:hypothetical protein